LSLKALSPNIVTLGIRTSAYEIRGEETQFSLCQAGEWGGEKRTYFQCHLPYTHCSIRLSSLRTNLPGFSNRIMGV
jgi:hypothetical protein